MSDALSNPVTQSEKQPLNFDLETIREVAALLRESSMGEICIETTSEDAAPARLLLRREPSTPAAAPVYIAPPAPVATTDATASETQAGEGENASTPAAPTTNVASPAVGVFRPAKNPVKEGDAVKVGQAVACVESMRVPHEVFSPVAGQILELRAQDGQGIEYGQVLFVIEETP
jgi:acetyl-CoA carboxylase biotin carboxyl carrier protein